MRARSTCPTLLLLVGTTVFQIDGTWSRVAPLPQPMQELSAAVLHGRIYVAGGIDGANRASAATITCSSMRVTRPSTSRRG